MTAASRGAVLVAPRKSRVGLLDSVWTDRRVGLALAAGLAIAFALASAWLTPRGPITEAHVLATLGGALALGVAAGLLTGSRWSGVLVPLVFTVVFELARLRVDGPTVDGIHLGSMYGMFAFVLGRGVHAVVALLPMIVGVLLGVELASRLGRVRTAGLGLIGWVVVLGVGAGLLVLAFAVSRPASTAPILGADGQRLPGSVAELTTVQLGGHEQALMIRGQSSDNPVLLFLAGGPGGTEIGAMRMDTGLEQHFVVVTWDQRGVGKSYAALDPAATHTPEQAVADTIALTEYLRQRFDEQKIYLVGQSWGSLLGVWAVEQRPELYHAFVGVGQMVNPAETDRMFWEDTITWAEANGNETLAMNLRENGPPPYADFLKYETALSHEHDWNPYPGLNLDREMPATLFVPENSLMDTINGLRSFLDTFYALYPQIQDVDLRRDATELAVPVFIVQGDHEARGRAVPADEWFAVLQAPIKERFTFAQSGHRPLFEEPAEFVRVMQHVAQAAGGVVP
jgi:proline iminopeptidase